MKKELPLKNQEINRILLELRDLLPALEFRYSEQTGLLESLHFDFKEEPPLDLNFFDSLPRCYPTPNLLRRVSSRRRPSSFSEYNGGMNGDPEERPHPRPRGSSGLPGRTS
ncbi:MAG: hypothetical protein D084_Lepto4C00132G0001 [Leptospirillum sp. Group IV 'UBA BS']|nr:MAG: hypothetical protein D084_Lepto4C00132G0001 [Leptospirillum sp. Group IV 'UBA BS']